MPESYAQQHLTHSAACRDNRVWMHNQGDTPRGDDRPASSPLRSYAKGKNSLWLLNSDTYRLVCSLEKRPC